MNRYDCSLCVFIDSQFKSYIQRKQFSTWPNTLNTLAISKRFVRKISYSGIHSEQLVGGSWFYRKFNGQTARFVENHPKLFFFHEMHTRKWFEKDTIEEGLPRVKKNRLLYHSIIISWAKILLYQKVSVCWFDVR